MLSLKVQRAWKRDTYTLGKWFVNGVRFYESLEDKDRGLKQSMSEIEIARIKVYGKTAIPSGTYKVTLSESPSFKNKSWAKCYNGLVPEIVGVKGFSGVRIHPFNIAEESLGCIGIGENKVKGKIINSVNCYKKLMDRYILPAWKRKEEIELTIE